jgi:hypothetical protein
MYRGNQPCFGELAQSALDAPGREPLHDLPVLMPSDLG